MATKTGFTTPSLNTCDGDLSKEWYVGFRHTCPVTLVRKHFQIRQGINYLKTIAERTAEGNSVARVLHDALKRGWNPHQEKAEDFLLRQQVSTASLSQLPFFKALEFAYSKKVYAKKSQSCVSGVIRMAQDAAKKLGMAAMPIGELRRAQVKELLEQMGRDRQHFYNTTQKRPFKGMSFTGNSYNKYKRYLQGLFHELVEYEAMEYNPCDRIAQRKEIVTKKHRHATEKEKELIKSHVPVEDPDFYLFLRYEYLTGIRPKELFSLLISDIDWFNQCFNVRPEEGKTGIARKVPIPDVLLPDMEGLRNLPADYFIFSEGFKPGKIHQHRDKATKRWKEIVIDGLGINVTLYSFKGSGGEAKRRAGIDAAAVQSGFGHTRSATTMIYLHGEQDRIHQVIKEHTPDL